MYLNNNYNLNKHSYVVNSHLISAKYELEKVNAYIKQLRLDSILSSEDKDKKNERYFINNL